MPLHVWTAVTNANKGVVVAGALTIQERRCDFKWVFSVYQSALDTFHITHPTKDIIDGDRWMREALRAVFPSIDVALGNWHWVKAVKSHFGVAWEMCASAFYSAWHSTTSERFETKWGELKGIAPVALRDYLGRLYCERNLWVWAWVHSSFGAGIEGTHRTGVPTRASKRLSKDLLAVLPRPLVFMLLKQWRLWEEPPLKLQNGILQNE